MSTYIGDIQLDDKSVIMRNAEIEREKNHAITDLLKQNHFLLKNQKEGPYNITLAIHHNKLIFEIICMPSEEVQHVTLSTGPFRKVMKDYFIICETYFSAVKMADPSKVEAIDMGRRAVHNEGAELLIELLQNDIELDFETARKIFTLIAVLHLK